MAELVSQSSASALATPPQKCDVGGGAADIRVKRCVHVNAASNPEYVSINGIRVTTEAAVRIYECQKRAREKWASSASASPSTVPAGAPEASPTSSNVLGEKELKKLHDYYDAAFKVIEKKQAAGEELSSALQKVCDMALKYLLCLPDGFELFVSVLTSATSADPAPVPPEVD